LIGLGRVQAGAVPIPDDSGMNRIQLGAIHPMIHPIQGRESGVVTAAVGWCGWLLPQPSRGFSPLWTRKPAEICGFSKKAQ
jgi:hypothetical protein